MPFKGWSWSISSFVGTGRYPHVGEGHESITGKGDGIDMRRLEAFRRHRSRFARIEAVRDGDRLRER